jgi:hypothetical protein
VTHTNDAVLPAGAVVRFYQTLPFAGEVPYCIEQHPIDPFTRVFADDFAISVGAIDTGVFVSSGATIALTAQIPLEGPGVYQVAGAAPLFEDGPLGTTVAPAASSGTGAVTFSAPSLSVAAEAVSASVEVVVTQSLSRSFNRGELLLSRDGALVGTVALDGQLQQTTGSPIATLAELPGGTPDASFESGLYYMSVRAWNSSSPSTTLSRATYISPVDLRQSDARTVSVPIG